MNCWSFTSKKNYLLCHQDKPLLTLLSLHEVTKILMLSRLRRVNIKQFKKFTYMKLKSQVNSEMITCTLFRFFQVM